MPFNWYTLLRITIAYSVLQIVYIILQNTQNNSVTSPLKSRNQRRTRKKNCQASIVKVWHFQNTVTKYHCLKRRKMSMLDIFCCCTFALISRLQRASYIPNFAKNDKNIDFLLIVFRHLNIFWRIYINITCLWIWNRLFAVSFAL